MIGEKELIKLFPNFKEHVQPSGIDLPLDEIYLQKSPGSLIDNEKNLPELKKLEPPIYILKPKTAYLATIDRKIKIPKGFSMLYLPRSTLLRSFISVHTAVGDPGFYGTLQFMLYNYGEFDYQLKQGERIAQGVVFEVRGSGEYNGSYQESEL
ncbi:deoxyuridine 5'-triphosphate nucleotidohydrolase [Methanobacterium alkalithermotolerans]|uniref:Deoxyuridine 5'-triphosphate nucleotidohydrolase n=1 Tax=Methanobacterium alkalithermotolerans TaxID=2731220 RepID=A0A8T8K9R4_9EURY|nr:deoxyuridine 5'-triphosphate nucleotidohydrolase [Methanobacterium alkalithermotolerans]QUH24335.1 deoxyuridine 5'-triphosphate nucleotidohydrolase [Methanobacterium alkalithermotolerans]